MQDGPEVARRAAEWERQIGSIDQMETEIHQTQLRLIHEQTSTFRGDLMAMRQEILEIKARDEEALQALTRRVEGLDERLWASTSGSEAERQRHRELEQQVQALDQHCRLHMGTAEETQERQKAKMLRVDHLVEELARRFSKVEDEVHLEARVSKLQ